MIKYSIGLLQNNYKHNISQILPFRDLLIQEPEMKISIKIEIIDLDSD